MKKKFNSHEIFLFFWIFFLTLHSYYSYQFNTSIPPLISAVIATALTPYILTKKASYKFSTSSIKITTYWLYITFTGILFSINNQNTLIARMLASPLFIASGIYFLYVLDTDKITLENSIYLALKIHVAAFLIQAISYYAGFGFIDFLSPFTGEEQRAIGGSFYIDDEGKTQLIRPTGLFNEPGTYSNIIFVLFLMYQKLKHGQQNSKYFNIFDWLLLLSIVLSFSMFGIVYVTTYMFYLIKNNKKLLIPISIISIMLMPFIYDIYIHPRFFSGNYEDTGIEFRTSALTAFYSLILEDNPLLLFFGEGAFTNLSKSIGDFVWNDLGLLIYLLVSTGIAGLLVLFAISQKTIRKNGTGIIAIILLMTKLSTAMILFWPILGFLLYGHNQSKPTK